MIVHRSRWRTRVETVSLLFGFCIPMAKVHAQASPLQTGADSLVVEFTTIATPLAVIVVMVLGVVALAGRISWGWPIAALAGICVLFGAQQMVDWSRGLFGV